LWISSFERPLFFTNPDWSGNIDTAKIMAHKMINTKGWTIKKKLGH